MTKAYYYRARGRPDIGNRGDKLQNDLLDKFGIDCLNTINQTITNYPSTLIATEPYPQLLSKLTATIVREKKERYYNESPTKDWLSSSSHPYSNQMLGEPAYESPLKLPSLMSKRDWGTLLKHNDEMSYEQIRREVAEEELKKKQYRKELDVQNRTNLLRRQQELLSEKEFDSLIVREMEKKAEEERMKEFVSQEALKRYNRHCMDVSLRESKQIAEKQRRQESMENQLLKKEYEKVLQTEQDKLKTEFSNKLRIADALKAIYRQQELDRRLRETIDDTLITNKVVENPYDPSYLTYKSMVEPKQLPSPYKRQNLMSYKEANTGPKYNLVGKELQSKNYYNFDRLSRNKHSTQSHKLNAFRAAPINQSYDNISLIMLMKDNTLF